MFNKTKKYNKVIQNNILISVSVFTNQKRIIEISKKINKKNIKAIYNFIKNFNSQSYEDIYYINDGCLVFRHIEENKLNRKNLNDGINFSLASFLSFENMINVMVEE